MDEIANFLGRNGYLPHGTCLSWTPSLLWTMVVSDLAIAAAYFSIPAAGLVFLRRRPELFLRGVVGLFAAFIFACGLTHITDVWTLWQPDYGVQALTKALTAVISVASAVVLWRLLPRAIAVPSVTELQRAVQRLEAEAAQRRSAEERLAEVQESLAVTLASIGAGFMATDREGRVTHMNEVAETMLGWRAEQARGRALYEVFVREDRPADIRSRNPVDVVLAQSVTVDVAHNVVAVSRGGRRTPLEVKAALTHADDGSVRGLALVLRDRSAALKAEETSSRLAALVAGSTDAIVGKTLDGVITSWNPAAEALFGYPAEAAIGRPVTMLIPPELQAEERFILARLARGEVVPPFETQRLTRDGRLIDVSISVAPIRDADQRIIGASKIARDIAPQKQAVQARLAAQRLEAENQQILEAQRLKTRFLASMSHELRTPLNGVIGFAELLHQGRVSPDSPKHREYLGHIVQSGRHLLQLVNDVLDLAKVESGRFEFHPETVALAPLVAEVTGVLQGVAQRRGVELRAALDNGIGPLFLDPVRLKQVLYNLLSNAIKFTPSGGHVLVRARPEGPVRFRLEVEDTGIGIAAADLPRLFVEFQQLDTGMDRRHEGTGLGLALTRRLVEAQGGSVGVRSERGRGTVFHIVLDRLVPARLPAAAQGVLVIEHDGEQGRQLARRLSEAGFPADAADTAEDALRRASGRAYGALSLSLVLPEHDGGLGLLARIRDGSASRDTPVRGLSLGGPATFAVADLLFKPPRAGEVAAALARLRTADTARVMVVDDDPLARELMAQTLAGLGMTALCLPGGREALAVLETERPDALILDLLMPGLDGFETLAALRRLPAGAFLPVFVWTSLTLGEGDLARLRASAQAVVAKGGASLDELLRHLAPGPAAA